MAAIRMNRMLSFLLLHPLMCVFTTVILKTDACGPSTCGVLSAQPHHRWHCSAVAAPTGLIWSSKSKKPNTQLQNQLGLLCSTDTLNLPDLVFLLVPFVVSGSCLFSRRLCTSHSPTCDIRGRFRVRCRGWGIAVGIFNIHPVYVKLSGAETSITGAKRC